MLRPALIALAASLCFFPLLSAAQDAGLYTAAQAAQGAAIFSSQCAVCHGAQLEGGQGPNLTGLGFRQMAATQQLTGTVLLDRISRTMPATARGSLKPEQYAALVALILQRLGYPAGSKPLTADSPGLAALDLSGGLAPAGLSPVPRNASQGVYSAAQMAQGKAFYSDNCLQCHGGELEGVEDAPPLSGKPFLAKWGGLPVGALHAFIDKNMPPGNGGALGAVSEAAVVAYILSKNNFPAGAALLPADPAGLNAVMMK